MKNITLTAAVILTFLCQAFAQYGNVRLDANKNYFNDGQPLVAEKALMFNGTVPENIEMIEVTVLPHKDKDNRSALYQTRWDAPKNANVTEFSVPMNFKLRSSEKYDFRFDYFRSLNESEKQQLRADIQANVNAYLDVNLKGDDNLKLENKPKRIMEGMNKILDNALFYLRSQGATARRDFSDVTALKLERLDDSDVIKDLAKRDSTLTKIGARESVINDTKDQINREIEQIVSGDWLILEESRLVNDYETESRANFLSVSFGYGGAYLSGKFSEDFDYGSAPFVGLSVPLGNSTFAPKVLSNASLTLGAFTRNFENEDGREVSGVLFNRPWFAGLDYKLFQFVRFTGGASFLQGVSGDGSKNEVSVRPFIGVGARINLNFSLEK